VTDPVNAAEIADLLHQLRKDPGERGASTAERAAVLACKADPLARIANYTPTTGRANTPRKPNRSPATPSSPPTKRAGSPPACTVHQVGSIRRQPLPTDR
jgi:hypothetical protein